MTKEKRVLAFDFGASSGRAIIGRFDGENISLEEVHRFSNDPVELGGTLYWDVLRLFHEIKQGLLKAKLAGGFDSVGIDTWGVDFGLLDEFGCLVENPVHYRDSRTAGIMEEVFSLIPREELYERTGIQFMELNTIFQLAALKKHRAHILERSKRLLFMPDLFAYFLTGRQLAEYSIATTSQLVDIKTGDWAGDLLERLEIPSRLLCPIVPSGTSCGPLRENIRRELGLDEAELISVCGHDTQSAITAVPSLDKHFAFLSSGTWSLFGTELEHPVVNSRSLEINITNEGGYGGSTGLLKNIIGLWLIQESRREWRRQGKEYSYAELERLALEAESFKCFIDPDSPEFTPPGDIPARVREFCRRTGQYVPQTVGEVMRCIYESLAMKYRLTFERLKECAGRDYPCIHVIGGGVKDSLLCRMTADACAVPVKAGPIEATVLGNIVVQLLSCGALSSIGEARRMILHSQNIQTYEPLNSDEWARAYERCLERAFRV